MRGLGRVSGGLCEGWVGKRRRLWVLGKGEVALRGEEDNPRVGLGRGEGCGGGGRMNCLKGPAIVPPAGLNTCQEWDHGTGACAAPASRTLHNMLQKIYDSAHVVRKTKIGNLIKSYCCKML